MFRWAEQKCAWWSGCLMVRDFCISLQDLMWITPPLQMTDHNAVTLNLSILGHFVVPQSKMVTSPLYNFVRGPVEVWNLMEKSPVTRSKKTSAPDRPNCCKGGPGLQPWVTHLLQGWQGTSELSQPTSSSSRTRDLGWHKVRQRGFCSLAMYLASET